MRHRRLEAAQTTFITNKKNHNENNKTFEVHARRGSSGNSRSLGIFAYEKHQQQELAMANPLLAENLAALTEDNNTYPRYKNHTDKSTNVEWETKVDTTGLHIKFKRTCVTYYTYCKETGKEDDICYGQLNKLETTCGDWAKD